MFTKVLIIIGAIFLAIYLGLNFLKNRIKKVMFSNFQQNAQNMSQNFNKNPYQNDDVVYKKDNTVILKGEAKSKEKK
jgi:preprotein translocase subunit SecG